MSDTTGDAQRTSAGYQKNTKITRARKLIGRGLICWIYAYFARARSHRLKQKEYMKIAVVGTGISGLSVGQMLNEKHEVVLFEKAERIGGLIKCELVNNQLFHRVGGH
ncbi:MAG TPA: NAD(P)-binding protein, partial [Segetibacter sp.]